MILTPPFIIGGSCEGLPYIKIQRIRMNEAGMVKTSEARKETDMDRVMDRLYRLREKLSHIDGSLDSTTNNLIGSEPTEGRNNEEACLPNGKIQELIEIIGTIDDISDSLERTSSRLSTVA